MIYRFAGELVCPATATITAVDEAEAIIRAENGDFDAIDYEIPLDANSCFEWYKELPEVEEE
jgi:hypothetical protein